MPLTSHTLPVVYFLCISSEGKDGASSNKSFELELCCFSQLLACSPEPSDVVT